MEGSAAASAAPPPSFAVHFRKNNFHESPAAGSPGQKEEVCPDREGERVGLSQTATRRTQPMIRNFRPVTSGLRKLRQEDA